MADTLSLLFELHVDGRPAAAGLQRFRKEIAASIESVRRAFTQSPPASTFDKATVSAQKLAVQSLELANRLERARQAAERLALAQQRIAAAQLKAPIADAHVRFFRAVQKAAIDADHHVRVFRASQVALSKAPQVDAHVRAFRAIQTALAKAPQLDAHVRAFRAIQKGVEDANHHVRVFRATEAALARAPQLDAHVRAFRAIEQNAARARREIERLARSSTQLQEFQQRLNSIGAAALRVGGGLRSMGASLAILVSGPLLALGRVAGRSAADIDAIRNRLIATEGSLEAANERLAQLRQLADDSIGVTRRTATDTFAILSTLGEITERTINAQIRAFGRLNAAFTIDDQQLFFRNLLQIFQQGFEIKDIKEALGRVPIFNQLLESAFGTSDPDKLRKLRAAGKLTLDTFLAGMAASVESNPVLSRINESFSVRFAKTFERLRDSLEPLGLAILGPLERIVTALEPIIVRIAEAFGQLPSGIQTAIVAVGLLVATLGPLFFILGGIASGIGALTTALAAILPVLATIGLPAILAVLGALVITIGRIVAVVAVLGLAWRNNFLSIREHVTNAATAIQDAFTRIKAVIEEITLRILPTLQSITTRVLGIITALWTTFGPTIVNIISTSFETVVRIIEATLRLLGNIADLALKIIDGDWRGAWRAFSRIVINALDSLTEFFSVALRVLAAGFVKLHAFIIRQAVTFLLTGRELATKLIAGIAAGLIAGVPVISDALSQMLLLAAADFAAGPAGGVIARTILNAMRKAALEGAVSAAVEEQQGLARIRLNPDGSLKTDIRTTPPPAPKPDRGADAETRRRIRLLELEAERAEAIAQQRIATENIFFEQRKTSLKAFTDFQIAEEQIVFDKKKKVFAAERAEAEKLGKGRDLALGQIRLKELQAELEFASKRNQLLANQQREELEAAKAHRQALLDIQDQADAAELARLEDLGRQGGVTAFDIASRRAEIDLDARRRRREELEIELKEADQNKEDREAIIDELKQFDAESEESVRRNERLKREALQETADAYRDYVLTIREALEAANEATRNAAQVILTRLNARVFLTQQERIKRQFAFDRAALDAEKRASDLRIDNAEREAVEKAKKAGEFESRALEIERAFNDLRLAEQQRFQQERARLIEDEKAELERADPNSTRSLFGDVFADFAEAIRVVADSAGVAISNLTVVLGSFGAAAAEHFANASAQAGNFISILLDGIDRINEGLADMLGNWVLTGETGSAALRKLLASTLAYYAKTFLIKALDNVGEGFSNLAKAAASAAAGNFVSAALYKAAAVQNFISAAKYGIASAATAVAGRFAAGDSLGGGSGRSTASSAISGGQEQQPRNREFIYGGNVVQPSSAAAREGSAVAMMIRTMREVSAALAPFKTATPDEVVMKGAAGATRAIGDAVLQHSKENNDFNRTLAENSGF